MVLFRSSKMALTTQRAGRPSIQYVKWAAWAAAALLVLGVLVWQALAAGGTPDPLQKGLSPLAMILSASVLVFREGLEAILVLAAVTAGMTRGKQKDYVRAIPLGAFAAFV